MLENLQPSRQRSGTCKTVAKAAVEQRLETLCRIQGETELNRLREKAKTLAASIRMQAKYEQLDEMIGAILGTRSNQVLKTATPRARAQGLPLVEWCRRYNDRQETYLCASLIFQTVQ